MAFKSLKDYNEEKFGGLFLLRNDGDYADVVFLYPSEDDVMVGDVHYIKSSEYSGYVQCTGKGCPACAKGIRVQTKLFIPVFNITAGEVQFWDRGIRFETQLRNDVFKNFPNPTEYVFRITRHGVANSVDTTYEIQAIGKNGAYPYAQILEENHVEFPKYYLGQALRYHQYITVGAVSVRRYANLSGYTSSCTYCICSSEGS